MMGEGELPGPAVSELRSGAAEGRNTRLQGRRLLLGRAAAAAIILVTLALFVISIPLEVRFLQQPCDAAQSACQIGNQLTPEEAQAPGMSIGDYAVATTVLSTVFDLIFISVALVILSRKSDDWMALLVATMLVVFGTATFGGTLPADVQAWPSLEFPVKTINWLGGTLIVLFFYLFPDGRFAPRWLRWVAPLAIVREWTNVFLPNRSDGVDFALFLLELATIVYAQVYRYRRVSNPVQRQQTKWVVYGACLAVGGFAGSLIIGTLILFPASPRPTTALGELLVNTLLHGFVSIIPISIGIAALRFRLWDIDFLINRTLVYVPLTAILAGIFAASITLSQKLFVALTGAQSDAATVLTTLVVVAAIEPIKDGLQHLVERRFKEAADPEKALRILRTQAESVLSVIDPDEATCRLLEAAVRAFQATGGAVFRRDGAGSLQPVHTVGEWRDERRLSVPIQSDGTELGTLVLGPRASGRDYDERDRQSLREAVAPVARAAVLLEQGRSLRGAEHAGEGNE